VFGICVFWLEDLPPLNESHGIDLKDNRTGESVMEEQDLIRHVNTFLGHIPLSAKSKIPVHSTA
jgi:hypothetical protein